MTAEGYAGIEVENFDASCPELSYALAVGDVQNAFHYLKINEEYGSCFCYPFDVTAKEVGMVGEVLDGVTLPA